jgi:hypothetical protein
VNTHESQAAGPPLQRELQSIRIFGLEEQRLLELDLAEREWTLSQGLRPRRQHHLEVRGGGHDHATLDSVVGNER